MRPSFEVEAAFYLWVNGRGRYSETELPAEFDVTDNVKTGENHWPLISVSLTLYFRPGLLAYFRHLRSVYLIARPLTAIEDIKAEEDADPSRDTGTITCTSPFRAPAVADYTVRAGLYDEGRKIGGGRGRLCPRRVTGPTVPAPAHAPSPWANHNGPKTPNSTSDGRLLAPAAIADIESVRVGFKSRNQNGVVLLNGKELVAGRQPP